MTEILLGALACLLGAYLLILSLLATVVVFSEEAGPRTTWGGAPGLWLKAFGYLLVAVPVEVWKLASAKRDTETNDGN